MLEPELCCSIMPVETSIMPSDTLATSGSMAAQHPFTSKTGKAWVFLLPLRWQQHHDRKLSSLHFPQRIHSSCESSHMTKQNVPVPENTQSIPTAPKLSIDPDLVPVGNHFLLSQKYRTELIALPADSFTSQQALSRENKLRTFLDSGILRHARPLVCHQLLFLSNYSLCDYYPSQSYSIILIQVCDVAYTYSTLLQIEI